MQKNKLLFACFISVSMFSTPCFSMLDTNTDDAQNEVGEEKPSSKEKIGPKVQKALNQALIDAARERDAKQVAILLGKGAKAYSEKQEVLDVEMLGIIDAALKGDVQQVEMLLDQEAATGPEKQKIWNEALLEAAEKGNTEQVQMLLRLGADINYKDSLGHTPFSLAQKNNHHKVQIFLALHENLLLFGYAAMTRDFSNKALKCIQSIVPMKH